MLTIFSLIFYSFSIITSGIENHGSNEKTCVTLEKWFGLASMMAFIDSIITICIPFIIISILNISICCKLMEVPGCGSADLDVEVLSNNFKLFTP